MPLAIFSEEYEIETSLSVSASNKPLAGSQFTSAEGDNHHQRAKAGDAIGSGLATLPPPSQVSGSRNQEQDEHRRVKRISASVRDQRIAEAQAEADKNKPAWKKWGGIALDIFFGILSGGPLGGRARPFGAKPSLRAPSLSPPEKLPSILRTLGAQRTSTGVSGRTESELGIQRLLDSRYSQPWGKELSMINSVNEIKSFDFPVPPEVYRAHGGDAKNGLRRAAGEAEAGDDYLAAILKHTARTGGSGGEVMSLTADRIVADSFSRGGKIPEFKIDTTRESDAFRTAADIILKDGSRLVESKKISSATLLQAIDKLQGSIGPEKEVFYTGGDIPKEYVQSL